MATRKRSKAAPKKKPRGARKSAPRSSSKREPKKKRPTKKVVASASAKTRSKKRSTTKSKKPTKAPRRATTQKKIPAKAVKPKAVKTKKTPIKAAKPVVVKKQSKKPKKAPTKVVKPAPTSKPKKAPTKVVKPAPTSKPKKPKRAIRAKLSREEIELALEAHALAHAPLYKSHDPKAMGRDKYGVYTTDYVNYSLNDETVDDVIKITTERGAEIADIIRARANGEGRILLWASYLVARTVRGRNEGYSEESVTYNFSLKQEVGVFWTGIRGTAPSRFPRKVREKVANMASTPTFLVAIFVYGRWARGKRRRRKQ